MARTNPQAKRPDNALKLEEVQKTSGEVWNPAFTWAITLAGTTFTVTPGTGFTDADLRFAKWRVTDAEGNTAYGALNLASRAAAVAITTSGLDPLKEWTVYFNGEILRTGRRTVRAQWQFVIPAGNAIDNPTGNGTNV